MHNAQRKMKTQKAMSQELLKFESGGSSLVVLYDR
jgi:hypothetical protein